jgi:hypothetical protein
MRILSILATLITSLSLSAIASANGPEQFNGQYGGQFAGGYDPCACEECDCCRQGCFGHHRNRRNAELGFNCGCNGSYKYPVPPLYTYHWPGMYSAQLMTEYHSPWRFPPLKPYTDEAPLETQSSARSLRRVQPAAAVVETRSTPSSSFSQQVERSLR